MPEWLARLSGDEYDLKVLSEHLRAPDLNVKKDDDGQYYLRSSDFASIANDDAREKHAARLVRHVNGAADLLLEGGGFPIELDGMSRIEEDGRRYHSVGSSVHLLYRVRTTIKAASPDEMRSLVFHAGHDSKVADALNFLRRNDWVSLYKAWEMARDAAGGTHELISRGWAQKRDQSRFTGTVQSREVLGDEARHASEKYRAPDNPMTLEEARCFVRSVVRAWINT